MRRAAIHRLLGQREQQPRQLGARVDLALVGQAQDAPPRQHERDTLRPREAGREQQRRRVVQPVRAVGRAQHGLGGHGGQRLWRARLHRRLDRAGLGQGAQERHALARENQVHGQGGGNLQHQHGRPRWSARAFGRPGGGGEDPAPLTPDRRSSDPAPGCRGVGQCGPGLRRRLVGFGRNRAPALGAAGQDRAGLGHREFAAEFQHVGRPAGVAPPRTQPCEALAQRIGGAQRGRVHGRMAPRSSAASSPAGTAMPSLAMVKTARKRPDAASITGSMWRSRASMARPTGSESSSG